MNYFNYFTEIEELFIRRRGRNLLLSPLDWALIEAWKQRGIPLHVTLRAIETVFDAAEKNARTKPNIKSLMYCRDAVETQYKDWLETQVGSSSIANLQREIADFSKDKEKSKANLEKSEKSEFQAVTSSPHPAIPNPQLKGSESEKVSKFFLKIKENLQNIETHNGFGVAVAETLAALEKLREKIAGEPIDLEKLEQSLTEIEQNLDSYLLENAEKSRLESINREIEKTLRPYKLRMADEIYCQTHRNLLLKRLREDLKIPRISLFYPL